MELRLLPRDVVLLRKLALVRLHLLGERGAELQLALLRRGELPTDLLELCAGASLLVPLSWCAADGSRSNLTSGASGEACAGAASGSWLPAAALLELGPEARAETALGRLGRFGSSCSSCSSCLFSSPDMLGS